METAANSDDSENRKLVCNYAIDSRSDKGADQISKTRIGLKYRSGDKRGLSQSLPKVSVL